MRRKPIPQSLFNWIAFLSALWFVVVEWVLKPLFPTQTHPFGFLILELFSKAVLAMFTGSIFFRITESFRDRKAKDKTEGYYQDFLAANIHHFDTLINEWKNEIRTDTPRPYFLTLSNADIGRIIEQWRRLEEMSSSSTYEETRSGISRDIGAFKEKLQLERAYYAYVMGNFTPTFMKELNAMEALLLNKVQPRRDDKREFDVQTWDLWRIRLHLLDLSNIYRREHKLAALPPIKAN